MYTTTDPVSDMLSRIRNAIAASKMEVSLPHSNLKEAVAKILVENKFLGGVSVDNKSAFKTLVIKLSPDNSKPKINEIVKLSTPGKRYYVSCSEIPKVKQGKGMVIISTSKGLMTGDQAQKDHIGGELICKVY